MSWSSSYSFFNFNNLTNYYEFSSQRRLNALKNISDTFCGNYYSNILIAENSSYPNYDIFYLPFTGTSNTEIEFHAYNHEGILKLELFNLIPYVGCPTDGLVIGDKYRIYDPVKKDYVLDGNSVPVVSAAYWRAVSGADDSITTNAVNWYWDEVGTVYLSYDPICLGEITFDNEIRVEITNGTDLRIRDYTPGDTQLEYEGYWVDRASVDITSLCRSGINSVVVSVRDNNSGKVGFVTPVYVKRKL